MNDLDDRLRALTSRPVPAPPTPDELRRRAADRRARKAKASWGVTTLVLVLTASLIGWQATKQDEGTTLEPAGTTTSAMLGTTIGPAPAITPTPGTRTLGGLTGVSVSVEPNEDLADGAIVRVRISGLERIPGAVLAVCAGDVDERAGLSGGCDPNAVHQPDSPNASPIPAQADQRVAVTRTPNMSLDNEAVPFDCAQVPAGCVLGIGSSASPVRGVLVPLHFARNPLPTPTFEVAQTTGLRGGQEIGYTATGLTPNAPYGVALCLPSTEHYVRCDSVGSEQFGSRRFADAKGEARGIIKAWAGIYDARGRTDCTRTTCTVTLTSGLGGRLAQVPIEFASDVVAWTPELHIVEPAPYRHGQTITLQGTGFRPGLDARTAIALCPSDDDPFVSARCLYEFTPAVVNDDGTVAKQVTLPRGGCDVAPGCHYGWVMHNGVSIARAPVTFAPGG